MAGVALGTSVWSFMTGVTMVKSGMSVAESVLMALLVYLMAYYMIYKLS